MEAFVIESRAPMHFLKKENAVSYAKKHSGTMGVKYNPVKVAFLYKSGEKQQVYVLKGERR